MKRGFSFVVFVMAAVIAAFAQESSAPAGNDLQDGSSSVAYVYVASSPGYDSYEISGFSTLADGTLKPLPGSPLSTKVVVYLAANKHWLFGTGATDIYSFSIAPDGVLEHTSSVNTRDFANKVSFPDGLSLDRSGATLYNNDFYADGANNSYQFFDLNQTTGALSYFGAVGYSPGWETPLSFIGNNEYAYGASCYLGVQYIYGFQRSNDGALTNLNLNPSIPVGRDEAYCPSGAAADPFNHVAVAFWPTTNGFSQSGPAQLAVYTADTSGNLTTNSTYENMPTTTVTYVSDMAMSPSGDLLAVSGPNGLEVFHFNGGNPITPYTGLLSNNPIGQIFWDNDHHLFAIIPAPKAGPSPGRLLVFTVTPTSYSQAPGSPYLITTPICMVVVPRS
jgi:hypothetical protein